MKLFPFALFLLSLPLSLRAVDIVDNIANQQEFSVTLSPGAASAHAFTTGPSLNLFESVTVSLYKNNASSAEVEVKLWAGSGNSPTEVLEDLGVQSIQPMGFHELTFSSVIAPRLEPETRYWISVNSISGSFDWLITIDDSNGPREGTFDNINRESSNGGVSWPRTGMSGDYYQFRVTGTPLSLITVMNTNDSGEGSLRKAIDDPGPAMGTTEIRFDPTVFEERQTIRLDGTELTIDKDLTIDASDLPNGVIISGDTDGDGTGESRVFRINAGKTVVMKSLIITGGKAPDDMDSTYGSGGAIYQSSGALTLQQCTVAYNRAGDGRDGGDGGNGGSGGSGGAIYQSRGTLTLQQCTVAYNRAGDGGDGGNGGGNGGNGGHGGGFAGEDLTLNQSTVSGNHAGSGGSDDGGRASSGGGGGIGRISSNYSVDMTDSIVAGNFVGEGIVPGRGSDLETDHKTTRSGVNLIGDNTLLGGSVSTVFPAPDPLGIINSEGDYVGTSGNPLDPLLGDLAANGGPTLTRLPLRGSPALNPTNGITDPGEFPNDQRGPGFDRIVAGIQDIGAVEAPDYAAIDAAARAVKRASLSRQIRKFKKKLKTAKRRKQVSKVKRFKKKLKKLKRQLRAV